MLDLDESTDVWLRTEYAALSHYFGNVITFRFTTAAFFIAAVALVLQVDQPATGHYVLLFAVSLAIWIVELRNRAIFDNLLRRAWQIEDRWRKKVDGQLPFFTHMTPRAAAEAGHDIANDLQRDDQTRILWFRRFAARAVSHTLGLDILYLSVMAYALWSIPRPSRTLEVGLSMDPVLAFFALAVMLLGYQAIRSTESLKGLRAGVLGTVGVLLLIAAAVFVWVKGA